LSEHVGGDAGLFQQLVQVFLDDLPRQLERLRAALTAGDAPGVRLSAHTLRGYVGLFSPAVATLAEELALRGRRGDLQGSAALVGELEARAIVLQSELSAAITK